MIPGSVAQSLNEVQLTNVYLTALHLTNHLEDLPAPSDLQVAWHLDTKVAFRRPSPTQLHLKVTGDIVYEEGSPRPLDVQVELIGIYESQSPIGDDQIPQLLQTHSLPLLWPYLRETISNVTLRTGGPLLVVPTLRINISLPEAKSSRKRVRTRKEAPPTALGEPETGETSPTAKG